MSPSAMSAKREKVLKLTSDETRESFALSGGRGHPRSQHFWPPLKLTQYQLHEGFFFRGSSCDFVNRFSLPQNSDAYPESRPRTAVPLSSLRLSQSDGVLRVNNQQASFPRK